MTHTRTKTLCTYKFLHIQETAIQKTVSDMTYINFSARKYFTTICIFLRTQLNCFSQTISAPLRTPFLIIPQHVPGKY